VVNEHASETFVYEEKGFEMTEVTPQCLCDVEVLALHDRSLDESGDERRNGARALPCFAPFAVRIKRLWPNYASWPSGSDRFGTFRENAC
jgi:hypothetical protein